MEQEGRWRLNGTQEEVLVGGGGANQAKDPEMMGGAGGAI